MFSLRPAAAGAAAGTRIASLGLSGELSIAKFIVRTCPGSGLYGSTALEASQIDSFIETGARATEGGKWIVGSRRTLADLVAKFPVAGAAAPAGAKAAAAAPASGNAKGAKGAAAAGGKAAGAAKAEAAAAPASKDDSAFGKMANFDNLALKDPQVGKVVTRFPPEPSGYMHIGHMKAALLNQFFAKKYEGKMQVRFDDTNPAKESVDFEPVILEDLARLDIIPDKVTHTSDYFPEIEKHMEKAIKDGFAYCDEMDAETMSAQRYDGIESEARKNSVEKNLALWKELLAGKNSKVCVRAKIDMQSTNRTLRDPVLYRTVEGHGARPLYDWACPIADSMDGVTHALRSQEYHDRNALYDWVLNVTKVRPVALEDFSRINFDFYLMSKRKLQALIDSGVADSWSDPRFPTVRGITRLGLAVPVLTRFILSMGASKSTVQMSQDKLWALNKKYLDPRVERHVAFRQDEAVQLKLDGHSEVKVVSCLVHPKQGTDGCEIDPEKRKTRVFSGDLLVHKADFVDAPVGEEITLMGWGNCIITQALDDKGVVRAKLNLDGDVKATKKKVTFISEAPTANPVRDVTIVQCDALLKKPKLTEDDVFEECLNRESRREFKFVGEASLRTLSKGQQIQIERIGYFIVDSVSPNLVLIETPTKGPVDPSKAAKKKGGNNGNAKGGKGGAPAAAEPEGPAALNIVVGKILDVQQHPDADSLYIEKIDLGEESGPRQIVSGLVKHVPIEEMRNRMVVVLANLKTAKLRGVESAGMVLCASSPDKVEPIRPPADAAVGTRISFAGFDCSAVPPEINLKKKTNAWKTLGPDLKTNGDRVASWKDVAFSPACTADTLTDTPVQ
jgi:glutamyl-tRNA synthetase